MKTKKLNGTGEESKNSPSFLLIGTLVSIGLAGLYFFKRQTRINIDLTQVIDYKNRTESQIIAQAQTIKELYELHGIRIEGDQLRVALQEFFDLEKTMHSHEALRTIESRLAKQSSRELLYGKKYGLYGFDFSETDLNSIYHQS